MSHTIGALAALAIGAVVVLLGAADDARAEPQRHAFVVGINDYPNLAARDQLQLAVADARAVRGLFRDLRFGRIVAEENVTRERFFDLWETFLNGIGDGDIAAVYFAGHGIEVAGANYLLPANVPALQKGEGPIREGSIALSGLLARLEARRPMVALVILDACRNNPFTASGRSIGGARGLSDIGPRPGILVMYSAGAGQVALDHVPGRAEIRNSVFTHVLLEAMRRPGLEIEQVAKVVRQRVNDIVTVAGQTQTPALYSQSLADVYLAGPPDARAGARANADQALPGRAPPASPRASGAGDRIVGRWRESDRRRLDVEIRREGTGYVLVNADGQSKTWAPGEIIGEVRFQGEDREFPYIGRNKLPASSTRGAGWGEPDKLVIRQMADGRLQLRYFDVSPGQPDVIRLERVP